MPMPPRGRRNRLFQIGYFAPSLSLWGGSADTDSMRNVMKAILSWRLKKEPRFRKDNFEKLASVDMKMNEKRKARCKRKRVFAHVSVSHKSCLCSLTKRTPVKVKHIPRTRAQLVGLSACKDLLQLKRWWPFYPRGIFTLLRTWCRCLQLSITTHFHLQIVHDCK